MVCMGNICRSPSAEGVFRHLLRQAGLEGQVLVDSAGTHSWHAGEAPDPRSIAAAARRGYDLSALRARAVVAEDFQRFDLILAMDQDNLQHLQHMQARLLNSRAHLALVLHYSTVYPGQAVPDPYYGGKAGFEAVLDRLEDACTGLIGQLRAQLGLQKA
ncbi:low molecular weight protein-tyrosine-phosphatase [Leeia sp.]|uniref:low molecular weight protein-tyrosine-phosphatase n=1 Tax=Leeia sp. TaxID=2884678 RepID=UPI0035B2E5A1